MDPEYSTTRFMDTPSIRFLLLALPTGIASVINHISEMFAYLYAVKIIGKLGHIKVADEEEST